MMSSFNNFEDIQAWQKARILAREIFELQQEKPFRFDTALSDQINRASGSIMDNIAEGFERGGNREFIQFLSYAKGSAGEVRSQLTRAFDRNYLDEASYQRLTSDVIAISKMISGLISYLKKSELKGHKFK